MEETKPRSTAGLRQRKGQSHMQHLFMANLVPGTRLHNLTIATPIGVEETVRL